MNIGRGLAIFGSVWSFVTLILALFVILGSLVDDSFFRHFYFLKVTFSNVGTDVIPLLDKLSTYEQAQIHKIKFFTVGLWNYCSWTSDSTSNYCSRPSKSYHFNLQDIVLHILNVFLTVNQPTDLKEQTDKIITLSKAMTAFYAAGIVGSLATLIFGLASIPRFRCSKFITTILAFVTWVCCTIATAIIAVMYLTIRNEINDGMKSVSASLGTTLYAIAYCTIATSFISFLVFLISICLSPSKKSMRDEANIPLVAAAPPPGNQYQPQDNPYDEQHSYISSSSMDHSSQLGQPTLYDPHGAANYPYSHPGQTAQPVYYDPHK